MPRTWANNGITTLNENISTSALTVLVVNGAVFGTPSVANETTAVIRQGATREIVHITNVSGNTLTLVRGREGTTGQAFTAGATIANVVTKAFTDEVETLLAGGGTGSASAFGMFANVAGFIPRGNGSDLAFSLGNVSQSSNGTLTGRAYGNSVFASQSRVGFVSAAAINSPCGRVIIHGYTTATEANTPPILVRAGIGISDATFQGTAALFVGMISSGGSVADPANLTTNANIGIGCSPGDTTLALYHSSGGGSVTKTSLGANFPANTTGADWYDIELRRAAGSYAWAWRVRNTTTGQTASGTATTNIPSAANAPAFLINRNTLTGTAAVGLDFSHFVVGVGSGVSF
jgi:hypothetical protein